MPRLIPRWSAWPGRVESKFEWKAVRGELFIAALIAVIYMALHFEEYLDSKFWWT